MNVGGVEENAGTVTAVCIQTVPLERGMLGRSYAVCRSCSPLALPTASGLESGSKSAKRLNHAKRSEVAAGAASAVHRQTGAQHRVLRRTGLWQNPILPLAFETLGLAPDGVAGATGCGTRSFQSDERGLGYECELVHRFTRFRCFPSYNQTNDLKCMKIMNSRSTDFVMCILKGVTHTGAAGFWVVWSVEGDGGAAAS